MSEERKEAFLERWSRLKSEPPAKAEQKPAAPVAKTEAPRAPLPPVEQLKPDSDFAPFMSPKVDPDLRRAALKKLFVDAHFNLPDPFEAYSEDYTKSEPIPDVMLKAINEARDAALRPPDAKTVKDGERQEPPQTQSAEAPEGEAKDVAGRQDA